VLQRAGHSVKVVTYGNSVGQLTDYDVIHIRGIRHHYDRKGRLSLLKSLIRNLGVFGYYARNWKILRQQLTEFSPDVAIVNFEPLVPLIARSIGIPVVSFDNQHALLHFPITVPKEWRWSAWFTKTAISLVARRAEHYVVMAFNAPPAGDCRVHWVPPVVQDEIRRLTPTIGPAVLVYLKQPNARFLDVLKQVDQQFLVYGVNIAATSGNLTYRLFSDSMHDELAACKAVMGTTGMSLTSEAVWLKKPFFGIPLKNEFEQMWNASMIKRLGFGDYSEEPTKAAVEQFLQHLTDYRESLEGYRFDSDAAGAKLLELIEQRRNGAEGASRGLHALHPGADQFMSLSPQDD
jgi:uncharacterized protein (TIGR00661 family)